MSSHVFTICSATSICLNSPRVRWYGKRCIEDSMAHQSLTRLFIKSGWMKQAAGLSAWRSARNVGVSRCHFTAIGTRLKILPPAFPPGYSPNARSSVFPTPPLPPQPPHPKPPNSPLVSLPLSSFPQPPLLSTLPALPTWGTTPQPLLPSELAMAKRRKHTGRCFVQWELDVCRSVFSLQSFIPKDKTKRKKLCLYSILTDASLACTSLYPSSSSSTCSTALLLFMCIFYFILFFFLKRYLFTSGESTSRKNLNAPSFIGLRICKIRRN